ncbi:MAG: AAA family ATPase [Patescibacteria group bacterium]|jgi:ATP-dependent 26S proteasome regulatory subunit
MVDSIRKKWEALQKKLGDLSTLDTSKEEFDKADPQNHRVERQEQLQQEVATEGRATAFLYEIVGKLEQSSAEPKDLAHVLWVSDPTQPSMPTDASEFFRVRVVASANATCIGMIGYALQEETDGQCFVVFANGEHSEYQLHDGTEPVPAEAITRAPLSSKTAVVALGGAFIEITIPENVTVIPGDTVRLDGRKHFSSVAKWADGAGDLATVDSIAGTHEFVVTVDSMTKRIVTAIPAVSNVEIGNRVVLDSTGKLILRNLGNTDLGFHFTEVPNVDWDDVIGQDVAKAALRQAIELPGKRADIIQALKMKGLKGVLLIGPPGCGKTRVAKAAAKAMLKLHGKVGLEQGFFFIKAPELLASLVGQGEALIRHIFAQGLAFFRKTGIQPIFFIDEIDAVGKIRGSGISSDATDTLVNTMLIEIDQTPGFIIGATNRHRTLDPALIRPGRISKKIIVGRPDQTATVAMFTYYFNGVTLDGVSPQALAEQATGELYSDRYPLYQLSVTTPEGVEEVQFGLSDLNSGALIDDAIVEEAKRIAATRIEKGNGPIALQFADVVAAIADAHRAEQLLDHTDALHEYSEQRPDASITVTKLYQGRKN